MLHNPLQYYKVIIVKTSYIIIQRKGDSALFHSNNKQKGKTAANCSRGTPKVKQWPNSRSFDAY